MKKLFFILFFISCFSYGIDDNSVVLNFDNADIQTVIKTISKLSGKNFVIDPKVKGNVTIVSDQPIPKSDSYKILESALRMQGFATVEADGVIKVLPEADAHSYGMKTNDTRQTLGDQLITKVFLINHGSATQLVNSLRSFISQNNLIAAYQPSNAIIITDYASNLERISKIIESLDSYSGDARLLIVKLRTAYAEDVAQTLQNYNGSGVNKTNSTDGVVSNITADLNSNSIIISSNVLAKAREIEQLALELDRQAGISSNNLHVIYLRNADAKHIAEVLKAIATVQDNPDLTPSNTSRELSDTSSMFQQNGSSSSSGSSTPTINTNNNSNRSNNNKQTNNDRQQSAKILIQAEPTTNSLIVQAPDAIYRNLRMIIDMIDVKRVQVMLEALIANVNTTAQGTFGVQWIGGAGNNNIGVGVVSNYGSSSLGTIAKTAGEVAAATNGNIPTTGSTLPNEVYVGLVTGTTTVGGQTVPGVSALADMIAANSAGNILGRPTILTLDNEEATIFVGSNIGLPSGSYATTGGSSSVNPFSTVNRQDIGTVLRLKPLVTQDGGIQLSIYQEDSSVDPNQSTSTIANGPNLLKTSLKTQILVNDGQIIALGGMTQDTVQLQS